MSSTPPLTSAIHLPHMPFTFPTFHLSGVMNMTYFSPCGGWSSQWQQCARIRLDFRRTGFSEAPEWMERIRWSMCPCFPMYKFLDLRMRPPPSRWLVIPMLPGCFPSTPFSTFWGGDLLTLATWPWTIFLSIFPMCHNGFPVTHSGSPHRALLKHNIPRNLPHARCGNCGRTWGDRTSLAAGVLEGVRCL